VLGSNVSSQVSFLGGRVVTMRTLEGFLPGVDSDVLYQLAVFVEGFPAQMTNKFLVQRTHLQNEKS